MDIDLTIKNYRCFTDANPARISLRPGFTAFVGPNNTGKSTLLKFFYEFRFVLSVLSPGLGNLTNLLGGSSEGFFSDDVFTDTNERALEVQLNFPKASEAAKTSDLPTLTRVVLTVPRAQGQCYARFEVDDGRALPPDKYTFEGSVLHLAGHPIAHFSPLMPVRPDLKQTLYIGPFRNALNIGGQNQSYFDIRVGQQMIQAWRNFKTGPSKRDNEAAYRLTENIRRIFGFRNLEINASEIESGQGDQTLQVFVDGKSYKLHELGSGIAQFFLVLASAAMSRPSYILIDEPELSLHPSLQLDFLTTLTSYATEGVLFATHSIGLARASADQVYSVQKNEAGESLVRPYEETPRLSEFLGELSFSGYRELGFDKVLLVEGPTEVKTIQQFLRLYGKDHKFVLLPLGGSGMIKAHSEAELAEIMRISDNVSALIDSERSAPAARLAPDREAFVQNCRKVGIEPCVLERRAIENYLTDSAVKRTKGVKYRALGPYELLKATPQPWAKGENWRIAREMTRQDLQGTDLGQFLELL